MTPEVTKTVLNKIILNVWIENGPVYKTKNILLIECHFFSSSTYFRSLITNSKQMKSEK
jgi:hypothetical protein